MELPVTINIANFEVAEIDLGEPLIGEPVRLALKASAVLNENGLDVDLEADRTDDKQGRFEISASVVREGAEIGVNLLLDEAEGGIAARLMNLPGLPSVNLSVAGSGPLDDFATDIALATDGQPRAARRRAAPWSRRRPPCPQRRSQATGRSGRTSCRSR